MTPEPIVNPNAFGPTFALFGITIIGLYSYFNYGVDAAIVLCSMCFLSMVGSFMMNDVR